MNQLFGLTAEQVRALTGLSEHQLRYWDKTEFFSPRYGGEDRRQPYDKLYNFVDLVGLRTIAILRNDHKLPLQELRKVGRWLRQHYDQPWSELKFYLSGGKVYFKDPNTGDLIAPLTEWQTVQPFEMQGIAEEMTKAVRDLRRRKPEQIGQVTQRRYVMQNTPVLAGTRIPTSTIWDFHRAGYTEDQILREYPQLTPEDIRKAIEVEESQLIERAG